MTTTINASNSGSGGLVQTADASGILALQTAGTTAVTVDASQNVGIGTTTIGQKLVIESNSSQLRLRNTTTRYRSDYTVDSSGNMEINSYDDTGSAYKQIKLNGIPLIFSVGSEAMRIDSSGRVLVGGTGPIVYSKLLSQFDGASNYGIVANDTSNGSNVGFMAFAINGNSTSGSIGTILRNGSANSVLYNTTSDQRLKENVTEADAALGIVEKIKVRKYDWIEGKQHEDHGFIAQELAEAVNGVVSKGKTEDDMWAVDYGKLTPLLCKAIQEQQALITSLTARIAALEGTPA
jgi:hypothetical protein